MNQKWSIRKVPCKYKHQGCTHFVSGVIAGTESGRQLWREHDFAKHLDQAPSSLNGWLEYYARKAVA